MQSFARGWSFLKQAWQMAVKDRDLLKPSIYSLIVGFLVSLVFIPFMIGAAFLFGEESLTGQIALFVLGAGMIFAQAAASQVAVAAPAPLQAVLE